MSLQLDPCPFCGCSVVGVERLNLNSNRDGAQAVYCRACGARGPVRMTSLKGVETESVAALVADEWNRRIGSEEANEHLSDEEIRSLVSAAFDAGNSFTDELAEKRHPPEAPSVESPAAADELGATRDPAPDNGGDVVAQPNTQGEATDPGNPRLQAPTPKTHVQPPGGGGALDTKHNAVAARLQAWLTANGTTIEKAVKRDHIDLGCSAVTLYALLKRQKVRDASLDAVNTVLDMLSEDPVGASTPLYGAAVVERLPNQFAPITGLKPITSPAPPRRCARTP